MIKTLKSEEGMTLVELIISISVLGIIIGPITMAMMLGLLSSNGTKERISDSAAAQLLSAYFPTDVQSSSTVEVPSSSTPTCGGDAGTVKVRFKWADPSTVALTSATLVEYIDRTTGDGGLHELWRYECDQSATPVVRSKQRLVRSVDFAGLPSGTAAITCAYTAPKVADACPAPASGQALSVTLNVRVNANSGSTTKANTAIYDPYLFTLQALRRQTASTP